MPLRDIALPGTPTWIDLASSDVEQSKVFYGTLFGWTFEDSGPEYGGYVNAFKGGSPVAGIMANNPEWNAPDGWSTYFATNDIEETLQKVAANGGSNCMQPMEVPRLGYMAMFADPGGARVGLWQSLEHKGFQIVAESGAPVWFELNTRDYATSVDFYTAAFGWKTRVERDTHQEHYTVAENDGGPFAGVNDATVGDWALPEGVPAHWALYLGIEDTDAGVKKVQELGGSQLTPVRDTQFGRLALVQDLTGGPFWLISV